jgi:transposase-like protein
LEGESQHFLASSAAVTLGLRDIMDLSEEEAESVFEAVRFAPNGGEPFCPWCNCEVAYTINRTVKNRKTGEKRKRRIFKCQDCLKQFSVTSGTEFHGRKLSFQDIMLIILLFVNGAAGTAALRARRDVRCNHKTTFVNQHKLREAMTDYLVARPKLRGIVEADSTDFAGSVRKANRAADRKKQPRRHMDKVIRLSVVRERGPGGRVVPVLGDEAAVVRSIHHLVETDADMMVDEHPAWNALFAHFNVRQIKHKEQYSDGKGTSTNWAETHWARFKTMYEGTYRHISPKYAQAYNGECAWREEHCRLSNGDQFLLTLAKALHHPSSKHWRGYFQRTMRKAA